MKGEIKMDKLIIPAISEDTLIAHIEDDDFFLTYGNPVRIVSEGNPDCVIISAAFARRLDELRTEIEEIPNCIAVMMSCEQYERYTRE